MEGISNTANLYSTLINTPKTEKGSWTPEFAISYTAQQISDKINEYLKTNFGSKFKELPAEELTSEKTATRVVDGIKMMYEAYKKQNEKSTSTDWQERFFELAKKGVQQGYDSAFTFLEQLGAFNFEGVKENAEKTKILIESKLKEFQDSVSTPQTDSTLSVKA